MIERKVLEYLAGKTAVPVYMELPDKLKTEMYVVQKTADQEANQIGHATVAVQSYGASKYDAAVLDETMRGYMAEITGETNISGLNINAKGIDFPDTVNKRYRYQSLFVIDYMED